MKQLVNKLLYPLVIIFLSLSIYLIFAGRLKFFFPITIYNYFSYLTEAFLHGSLSFVSKPPYLHDLITFNDKIYMYWGPAPVLLIIPFVFFFGRDISDALYTAIIASFSPLILYFILIRAEQLKLFILSNYQKIFLCIFFAFGTVHFYLSIFGTVWFTSQVVSIFYLLLALLFMTFYLSNKSLKSIAIASVFFSLAVISRTTLIFYIVLFLAFVVIAYLQSDKSKNYLFFSLVVFILISSSIFLINFCYNYLRFGSFFDNGYSRHNFAAYFSSNQERYGFFHLAYIPKNFYHMFINFPQQSDKFPFFHFDKEGNSVLFTSPLFLLLIYLVQRRYWQSQTAKLINFSIITVSALTIWFLLNFWGTGWVQFGYRYFLDIIPALIFLLAEVIKDVPFILTLSLLTLSILINLLGTLWFIGF